MEKIMQYVKAGKGRGFIFLLAAAVIISFIGITFLRQVYHEVEPQIMLAADEFLPITVQDGKIVDPAGAYKKVDFKFGEKTDNTDVLPIILDTREAESTVPEDKLGIFIMTDVVYVISPRKIDKIYLADGVWDKAKVQKYLNSFMSILCLFMAVILVGGLFLILLIKTLLIAWLGKVCLRAMQKTNLPDFGGFMRLSAVIVALLDVLLVGLNLCCNFSLSIWVRGLIALILVVGFLHKSEEQNV